VRLVGADGQQLGVVPTPRALALAQSEGYDLIEVAPNAVPPVCKIGDYGKIRYETQQREREAKKKQRTINWKEVRIAPKIDEHDLETKIKTAARLLGHGDKLKLVVRFRGRELAHPDRGRVLLMQMAERLKEIAAVERPPLLEGRQMIMVMGPLRPGSAPAVVPVTAPIPAPPPPAQRPPASPPSQAAQAARAAAAATAAAARTAAPTPPAAAARPAAATPRPATASPSTAPRVAPPAGRPAPAAPAAAAPPRTAPAAAPRAAPATRPAATRTQRPA
jgi:translation initiation factor IF-3